MAERAAPEPEARFGPVLEEVRRSEPEMLRYLRRFISVPSVTGDEGPCQAMVASFLQEAGLRVETFEPGPAYAGRPNVVGLLPGETGRTGLALNGHVDVVGAEPVEAWTAGPWSAQVRDGKIYGRGTADAKSALVASLFALRAVARTGGLQLGAMVQSVVGEEQSGEASEACLRRYPTARAVVLEPTDLEVHSACLGGLRFRVHLVGRTAHLGCAWEGANPYEHLVPILEAFRRFQAARAKRTHPLYGGVPLAAPAAIMNVKRTEPSSWWYIVPEEVTLEGHLYCLPGENPPEVGHGLGEELARAAAADPWLAGHPPRLEVVRWWPPYALPPGDPLVGSMARALEAVGGGPAVVAGFNAGCNANALMAGGLESAVVFGPGRLQAAHMIDEHCPLEQVLQAARVLGLAVAEVCGWEPAGPQPGRGGN